MVGDDWLALPGEDVAEKNTDIFGREMVVAQDVLRERAAAEARVAEVTQNLPAIAACLAAPAEPPADAGRRLALLDKAWKKLSKKQKTFLTLLRENRFNERATLRLFSLTKDSVSRTTVRRWVSEDDNYLLVMQVMKSTASGESIDRERLLLRAEEIAEEALDPVPILYQGAPTGFYENNKETALRANEQLMKAAGMLRGDEKTARVVVRVVNLAGPEEESKKTAIEVAAEVVE